MNQVGLVGRLTRDPELRYTQGGTAHCRFTLAVDRGLSKEKREEAKEKGLPTADFISCQAWGKTAELIANYLGKGRQVGLEGYIRTGSYTNKDGQRVYTTDVNVYKIHFISDGAKRGQENQVENSYEGSFYPVDNDDVPF